MFPYSSEGLYSPTLSFVPCTGLRTPGLGGTAGGRNRFGEDPEVGGPGLGKADRGAGSWKDV